MDTGEALRALKLIHEATEGRAFLNFGTLLGCVRDNAFLPWDHDLDVGILRDEFQPSHIEALLIRGFRWRRSRNVQRWRGSAHAQDEVGNYSHSKFKLGGVKLDLDVFVRGTADGHCYCQFRERLFRVASHLINPTAEHQFHGVPVRIPANHREYLEFLYGPDWQTPKRHWYRTPEHRAAQSRFYIPQG